MYVFVFNQANPCRKVNGMLDATIIPTSSITLSEPALQPNVDQIRNGPLLVPADITTFTVTIDLPGDIQLGSINLGSNTNIKSFEVYIRKPTDTQPVLYKVTKLIICIHNFDR